MMHIVLAILALQDEGWERPVELDKTGMIVPWDFAWDGEDLRVVALEGGERDRFSVVVRDSSGKKICSVGGIELDGPPTSIIRKGKMDLLLIGPKRQLFHLGADLRTGKASPQEPVALEGLERAEDDLWPMAIEHDGALWLAIAENGGKRLFAARSGDDGKTWSVVSPAEWKPARTKGSRPLIFATGSEIHVVFSAEAGTVHSSTADGGKTWTDRKTRIDGAPMAVASREDRACLVFASGTSRKDVAIRSLVTSDGGKSWTEGGELFRTDLDEPSVFCNLSVSGDRVAFFGMRIEPGKGERAAQSVVLLSADGGRSWKDLEFGARLARSNLLACGGFAPDGRGLVVAYVNTAEGRILERQGESYLLLRRWGRVPPRELSDAEKAKARGWIEQLGSDDLDRVDEAERGLLSLGERAMPLLREAAGSALSEERKARLEALMKRLTPVWWKG